MKRLGLEYIHETFGNRNRIKRFYNNVNAKTVKSIEEIATAIALIHNLKLNPWEGRGVIPG